MNQLRIQLTCALAMLLSGAAIAWICYTTGHTDGHRKGMTEAYSNMRYMWVQNPRMLVSNPKIFDIIWPPWDAKEATAPPSNNISDKELHFLLSTIRSKQLVPTNE